MNDLHVRLIDPKTGQLLREHLRTKRGWHRIADGDQPAQTPKPVQRLLATARSAGPHRGVLCTHIHEYDGDPCEISQASAGVLAGPILVGPTNPERRTEPKTDIARVA